MDICLCTGLYENREMYERIYTRSFPLAALGRRGNSEDSMREEGDGEEKKVCSKIKSANVMMLNIPV